MLQSLQDCVSVNLHDRFHSLYDPEWISEYAPDAKSVLAPVQDLAATLKADASLDSQKIVQSDLYVEPVWPLNPLGAPVRPYMGPKSWAVPLRHAVVVHTTDRGQHVITDRGRSGMTFFRHVETGDAMVCLGDGNGCLKVRAKHESLPERLEHSVLFKTKRVPEEQQVLVNTLRNYAISHGTDPLAEGPAKNKCGGPSDGLLNTLWTNGCQEYARVSFNLSGGDILLEQAVPMSYYRHGALKYGSIACLTGASCLSASHIQRRLKRDCLRKDFF